MTLLEVNRAVCALAEQAAAQSGTGAELSAEDLESAHPAAVGENRPGGEPGGRGGGGPGGNRGDIPHLLLPGTAAAQNWTTWPCGRPWGWPSGGRGAGGGGRDPH